MTTLYIALFVAVLALLGIWAYRYLQTGKLFKKPSTRLYVDDARDCPQGWDLARSFHEAIVMLETKEYDLVSLDHDLGSYYGNKEMTGRDILNWLIARKLDGKYVPHFVNVHSANPVGRETMTKDIIQHWGRLSSVA